MSHYAFKRKTPMVVVHLEDSAAMKLAEQAVDRQESEKVKPAEQAEANQALAKPAEQVEASQDLAKLVEQVEASQDLAKLVELAATAEVFHSLDEMKQVAPEVLKVVQYQLWEMSIPWFAKQILKAK